MKAEDGASATARAHVIAWYDGALSTRLNDKERGVIIVVMQRLHEEDPTGYLIERGGRHELNLPAIAIANHSVPIGPHEIHRRKEGDILPTPKRLKVKGGALTNVFKGLLRKGLVTEHPAPPDAPTWRESGDGQRFLFTVSPAGLEAIGVEPEREAAASASTTEPKPKRQRKTARKTSSSRKKPTAPTTNHRKSKQDTIVDMLRPQEGATIADLQAATGWQPHSVRAALTGLRKKGHAVTRSKADGDVTRYRITSDAKDAKS